jgi:hypothetical protein
MNDVILMNVILMNVILMNVILMNVILMNVILMNVILMNPLPIMAWPTAATLSLLLANKTKALLEKRHVRRLFTVCTYKLGTKFPKGLILVQQYKYTICTMHGSLA